MSEPWFEDWEAWRETQPQYIGDSWWRCQDCGEPFHELGAGIVSPRRGMFCGYCSKTLPEQPASTEGEA